MKALAAVTISLALFAAPAAAIDNVKFLVPANPGGGWDQTARNLGAAMQAAKLVKNVQYDNKGGAGGTIGLAQFVNAAKGDGGALLAAGLVMVGAIELNKSPVNLGMVTPIARLTSESNAIVVPANSKIKSLKELIDQFKANPASVSWGGGSAGGTDHVMVGLIAKEVGADPRKINYVPFKGGGEALQAIIGGHVTAGVSGYGEFAEQIKAGKMRALAVSGGARIAGVDIPTMKEQGVAVEIANWRGVFGAPGLNEKQRGELVKLVSDAAASPAWKETLKRMDWNDVLLTGDPFKSFVEAESKRINAVLKDIGLLK
jgi:putative tricarboxylic transport membrane protein